MGPRHFSRGIYGTETTGDAFRQMLQWGRGISAAESTRVISRCGAPGSFNGAAAFQPRNHLTNVSDGMVAMLQWGRGISAAESSWHPPGLATTPMLQWGRGISAAESHYAQGEVAVLEMLQWGRGISAAESIIPSGVFTVGSMLQWGRGISAAESHGVVSADHPLTEASMGPRHFSRGIHPYPSNVKRPPLLQWGRGISAAESK